MNAASVRVVMVRTQIAMLDGRTQDLVYEAAYKIRQIVYQAGAGGRLALSLVESEIDAQEKP